jgi:hypothetical protein
MRSLADDLRHRDDTALAELLRARPDLVHPVPVDISALATRAGSATSVARALDGLDRFTLQVAETIAACAEPVTGAALRGAFVPALYQSVDDAVNHLVSLAVVWGDDPYRMVRTARDAFGPHPGGLGPTGVDLRPKLAALTAESLRNTLADAPGKAVELLHSMMWGSPVGHVDRADRVVTVDSAQTPIEWLLARDLLVARGPKTITLPREVGLALRELDTGIPCVIRDVSWPLREPMIRIEHPMATVDRSCGQHAHAAVDAVTELLESWSLDAPVVLRTGGLGVRDLAAAARTLDTDEITAAFWLELSLAAGLLARDGQVDEAWRPTSTFDEWLSDPSSERWAHLALAWWHTDRAPQIVRGAAQADPAPHALSEAVRVPQVEIVRAEVMGLLADNPPGAAVDADDIAAVLDDRRPRLHSHLRTGHIHAVLDQAELLGVTGMRALGAAGRALTQGASLQQLAEAIGDSMPEPVTQVLIQGDLTAIAPGPLRIEIARQMRLLADIESFGAGTVFRFSESSLRRGFDAGRDAHDILTTLTEISATPLPQALEYLITDLGRRHGRLRVGLAGSYIRSDDTALVRATLAEAHGIDMIELAPGVLVSTEPPDRVLAALRASGLAPLAESSDGRVLAEPTRPMRSPARSAMGPSRPRTSPRSALIDAAIATLRATTSERLGAPDTETVGDSDVPTGSTSQTLTILRDALSAGRVVRLGYVDSDGDRQALLATPVRLAPGTLTAMDHTVGQVRAFTLARITGAAIVR